MEMTKINDNVMMAGDKVAMDNEVTAKEVAAAISDEALIESNGPDFGAQFFALAEEKFGEDVFAKWLSELEITQNEGSELILTAPSKFVRDWVLREFVENKKGVNLLDVARGVDNSVKKVSVITPEKKVEATFQNRGADNKVVNLSQHNNVFAFGTELNAKYVFDNFVSAKYNKFALSMAKIAAKIEQSQLDLFEDNIPLFIHGGVGMGKTHLAQAVAWKIKEEDDSKKVVYLSAEKFMYHFVQSVRGNDMMNFKEQFRSVDVLIIDDVQFIAGKQGTQEEFMHSFNHLVETNKQVILVCDRSPSDLESIDEKLKSRISGGMIVNFKLPDYADRFEILKSKAAALGEEIDDEILDLMAAKINSSVRDLDGALRKLIANKVFGGEEISLESARNIVMEYVTISKNNAVSVKKIQKVVADFYRVKTSLLSQANRQKDVAKARQVAMYLAKKLTDQSLPKIGREFNKNHATVLYAARVVQELVDKDAVFAKEVKVLEEKVLG